MLKSRYMPLLLFVILLTIFCLGVIGLFKLRFSGGDIYPPYSSLRADPLGTKVLYESLGEISGFSVDRFYKASSKLKGGEQRALYVFGLQQEELRSMAPDDYTALHRFMTNGGRVVICLLPEFNKFESTPEKPHRSSHHGLTNNATGSEIKWVSLLDKDGLRLETDNLFDPQANGNKAVLAEDTGVEDLPPAISWHSGVYFAHLDADWQTLYERKKHPVIIERSFGLGSMALCSDSYFVSNEALRRERHPALLAWLTGGRGEILFDETHLGVEEHPGVAGLMRQYHLEGVVLGLAFIAALFIWRSSAPLVPPLPEEAAGGGSAQVLGKESAAGFASLLRRSVHPADILSVSYAEWKSAFARDPRALNRLPEIERVLKAEEALSPGARRPMEAWRDIHRILTERR